VLLLEGGTRLLGIHFPGITRPEQQHGGLWTYDRSKGWFHKTHALGASPLGGPDEASIRTNALGLRGGEVAASKAPGTRRVLVVGDSYVFGVGVDEEHTLPARLQRMLSTGGESWEVLNLGVAGYSTDQEYVLFRELGPRLAPDVVVLVVCDNDFEGNTLDFVYRQYYKPRFKLGPDGDLAPDLEEAPPLSGSQRAKLWLGRHSNAWNLVRSRESKSAGLQAVLDLFQVAVAHPSSDDPVRLMLAFERAFREDARRLGASFVTLNTAHARENTPLYHALRPMLRAEGIAFLGLEGVLGEARSREPARHWDFGTDAHWNVDATRVVASVLTGYLRGQASAPPTP
jgi:GDSL-like Lipase/Acylhydrolase family